jgi:tetratricopeptide (TPR) repeat protein
MAEGLTMEYPNTAEYKDLLGRCSCALADLLIDLRECDKAERLCRQAVALTDEAQGTSPSTTFYQIGYLRARSLLAGALRMQGRVAEARETLQNLIDWVPSMTPEMADSSLSRRFQAEAYLQLAEVHDALSEPRASEEAAEKARELIGELPPIMRRIIRVDRWKELGKELHAAETAKKG